MSELESIRTHQLAELLSVSTVTIWKWEKKDLLPPNVKFLCTSGWRKSDIEVWLQERTEKEAVL